MKIYTRTGDKGETSLFSGRRVFKNHHLVNLYGKVDELNSSVGFLKALLNHEGISENFLDDFFRGLQDQLFQMGSFLAADGNEKVKKTYVPIRDEDIIFLEKQMDQMDLLLPKLMNFILPGGHLAGAYAHVIRTEVRRLERSFLEAKEREGVELPPRSVEYMNRLSDFFFVMARWINTKQGVQENLWKPQSKSQNPPSENSSV